MIIGVPKEIKENEFRIGLVPAGAGVLKAAGHAVLVESGAGAGSSISDEDYARSGAEIVREAGNLYDRSDIIVKVKEPQPTEYACFRDGLVIFTFFHLAANRSLGAELLRTGVTAIAYETIETASGLLPILSPMSEVAGRIAVQAGANHLLKSNGGSGILLSGVPGVERGGIMIIGGGTVGLNAAKIAVGLGARVTLLDTSAEALRRIDDIFYGRIDTLFSNPFNIEKTIKDADLVIGAVHIPGARTPTLVTRKMLPLMKKGSVIVDVSVDQGGCVETIRPTTHGNPVYEIDGILHYGVANMPGAVPRTSTYALTNATIPYLLKITRMDLKNGVTDDNSLQLGINIHKGRVTHPRVAEALGAPYQPLA